MSTNLDEIIAAAVLLGENDRMRVVTWLLETLPENAEGLSEDDPDFLEELARRANDLDGAVPIEQLWERE